MTFFGSALDIPQIWKLQQQLIDACPVAIKQYKPIYIGSGHSLGKDYICAALGLWFLYSYSPSIVIQTAPTDRQVKKIMWAETLGHWNRKKMELGGEVYANPYLEIKKENWYMIGFTTKESGASKKAEGGKFQGFHSPNICVIVTESQAVEDEIRDQIDAVTTAEHVLMLFLGNPTRASGWFAKGLKDKVNNIVFNFSCLENPNYLHRREVIPGLASYEWVENKRIKWGEDDPRWFGRVLGQIPKSSISNVFSQNDIDLMRGRTRTNEVGENCGVAIDVAGEGDDSNVIYAGRNGMVEKQSIRSNQSAAENALKCQLMKQEVNGNFIIVDSDGMGIKEWQELNNIQNLNCHLVKFHGSGACTEKQIVKTDDYQFGNKRAEAWFAARDRARRGDATIPSDPELEEDLLEVKFFEKRGKIWIEDKSDIKERLGRSPDKADAWVMLQWGFEQRFEPVPAMRSNYEDRQGRGELVVPVHENADRDYSGY